MLREEFFLLAKKYGGSPQTTTGLWNEIETAYTGRDRYFHNASHLEQLLAALLPVAPEIEDWDTLAFALIYHDLVYDVVRYVAENDNEDLSADAAEKALQELNYPAGKIERCKAHILATKHHKPSPDGDTNFLTDADLSVLGQPWEEYKLYMDNIRKEYEVYPDNIYYAGRSSVLKNFLRMQRLFKTEHFHQLYGEAATENIKRELEIISFR